MIKGSHYCKCSEPALFQEHLQKYTDFTGVVKSATKICKSCYEYNLTVSSLSRTNPSTNDSDLEYIIKNVTNSICDKDIDDESRLTKMAMKLTTVQVARELKSNRALTLRKAFQWYNDSIQKLLEFHIKFYT